MIGTTLSFLHKRLAEYFSAIDGPGTGAPKVVFLSSQNGDSIRFQEGAITLLLINMEQDEIMRKGDQFLQKTNNKTYKVQPEIRLNLYLLFVANWDDYITGLDHLSLIIRFFQANKVFDKEAYAELQTADIEKLTVELITLPFAQQNEVWNALRTTYKPSALFKVRMLVFTEDISTATPLPEVKTVMKEIQKIDN